MRSSRAALFLVVALALCASVQQVSAAEKYEYQAEVTRLLDIIINSLYSSKEIFLRELISNASDALDKIRFLSVKNPSALGDKKDLDIRISFDKEAKTITITDSGVGMTKKDLVDNLGTIARSGTKKFLESLENAKEGSSQIGQFGVGFYSAFLVADKVEVRTKHNDDGQYVWRSAAGNSFEVDEDKGPSLGRGTSITLHLKDDAAEYADARKITDLVKKHSNFVSFPVYVYTDKEVSKEVPADDEVAKKDDEEKKDESAKKDDEEKKDESVADSEKKAEADSSKDNSKDEVKAEGEKKETDEKKKSAFTDVTDEDEDDDDDSVKDDSAEKKPKTKHVTVTEWNWEKVTEDEVLWSKSPNDVTKEEYTALYKHLTGNYDDPIMHKHFRAEGALSFKSILYVPAFHMADFSAEPQKLMKLFVRKVLISDNFDLLPQWLSFLAGLVDSDDLPLNVSRELLQHSKILEVIKKKLTAKAVDMFEEIVEKGEEEYKKFYDNYAKYVKLGVIQDDKYRARLSKLLRFPSTAKSNTSLADYLERAPKEQEQIYYLAGDNVAEMEKSPLIEQLRERGLEVLFFTDPIDVYLGQHLTEFEGKKVVSVTSADMKLPKSKKVKKEMKKMRKELSDLRSYMEDLLKEEIEKVQVTDRLVGTPVAVVAGKFGVSAGMEKILKAQALGDSQYANTMNKMKKTLQINPVHYIVRHIKDEHEKLMAMKDAEREEASKAFNRSINALYMTARVASGYDLNEPVTYANVMFDIIGKAVDADPSKSLTWTEIDAPAEEPKSEDANESEKTGASEGEDASDSEKTGASEGEDVAEHDEL